MPYDNLRKGRFSEHGRIYFITTVLADREKYYFRNFACARFAMAEMRVLHDNGVVNSLAWVIMPDHVHWLFQLEESLSLPSVIKRFKARSAHSVNRHLNRQGMLWQKGFYDRAIRKEEDIRHIARYIVANPLRAGLVKNIGDYPHWDAIWL
ncbi:MAG: REP-associated tyrosine transposase [Burkholderiaceae bacterium]